MNTASVGSDSLHWETKNPAHPTSDIRNDAFRNAFDAIVRRATPFMDHKYFYPSDFLWDAQTAANMGVGDEFFILVRTVGTNVFVPFDQSAAHVTDKRLEACMHVDLNTDHLAVLRVQRAHYDTFHVSVVHSKITETQ